MWLLLKFMRPQTVLRGAKPPEKWRWTFCLSLGLECWDQFLDADKLDVCPWETSPLHWGKGKVRREDNKISYWGKVGTTRMPTPMGTAPVCKEWIPRDGHSTSPTSPFMHIMSCVPLDVTLRKLLGGVPQAILPVNSRAGIWPRLVASSVGPPAPGSHLPLAWMWG